jgi:hypothetical protein
MRLDLASDFANNKKMYSMILILFFAIGACTGSDHAKTVVDPLAGIERSSYLRIKSGTRLANLNEWVVPITNQLRLRAQDLDGSGYDCDLYRRRNTSGVKRITRFSSGTVFEVLGSEVDMPVDSGERAHVNKSGLLLVIRSTEPPGQVFGIQCVPGPKQASGNILAGVLKTSFSSQMFNHDEIEN